MAFASELTKTPLQVIVTVFYFGLYGIIIKAAVIIHWLLPVSF